MRGGGEDGISSVGEAGEKLERSHGATFTHEKEKNKEKGVGGVWRSGSGILLRSAVAAAALLR